MAKDVARRLRDTRAAFRIEYQRDFGTAADIEQSLYNQFETGRRLLTLQAAMKLCHHYGITLDWIYRGDPSGLPYKLYADIQAIRKQR